MKTRKRYLYTNEVAVGDILVIRDTLADVLRIDEPTTDESGKPYATFWVRRRNTGKEGRLFWGARGTVVKIIEDAS